MSLLQPNRIATKIGLSPELTTALSKLPQYAAPSARQQSVSQFATEVTRQTGKPIDPGVQSRMAQQSQPDTMAVQQQAYQTKLGELNNWSKGITGTMRAGAVKKQAQSAVKQTQKQIKSGGTVTRTGGGGSVGVTAGGWGGFRNGQIPTNSLAGISFARGHMMEVNAARNLEAMNAAYRRATGRNIGITDSYRSLAGQHAVARTKPGLAAKPGTSNHGWGKALDLNVKGDRQLKAWLDANAHKFGFVNPGWAKNPNRYEPWHWEFTG